MKTSICLSRESTPEEIPVEIEQLPIVAPWTYGKIEWRLAPSKVVNHNETVVAEEEVELVIEDLEDVIAPATVGRNPKTGE